jgi:hypothetical protein
MSLKIGGSASKTKTTSDTATHSTTTPILPSWATGVTQTAAGRVGDLFRLDPQSLIPGAHPLQQQAAEGAQALSGAPWNYEGALDLTRGAARTNWLDGYMASDPLYASGGKAYDYVDRYMNPYLHDVVDSTSADLDAHEGQVRAQQALDLAGAGAFGGSGAALTQSMTEGELSRARATTLSGLRSHAYDTALGAAAGDAERATQARIANSQTFLQDRQQKVNFGLEGQRQQLAAAAQAAALSSQFADTQRQNLAAQAQLGDALRTVDQEQRQAPITTASQIVAMLQGLPLNLFRGEDTSGTEHKTGKETSIGVNAEATIPLGKKS